MMCVYPSTSEPASTVFFVFFTLMFLHQSRNVPYCKHTQTLLVIYVCLQWRFTFTFHIITSVHPKVCEAYDLLLKRCGLNSHGWVHFHNLQSESHRSLNLTVLWKILPAEAWHTTVSSDYQACEPFLSGYPWLTQRYVWTCVIMEAFANSVNAGVHDYLSKLPRRFMTACVTQRVSGRAVWKSRWHLLFP